MTRVLVVDDLEANLVALAALLADPGIEVLQASSGGRALELLLEHDVAVALLDVQMPKMDGFELAELIRGAARTRDVPIIFLTAAGPDPGRRFRGYEAGAVDFLTKPIEREPLLAAIARALQADAERRAAHGAAAELRGRFALLTAREREVFDLVVAGKLNKQVADALGIAERTVKAQRAQVMVKLGAANAAELGRIAAQLHERDG